jgi:hypothetical protein
MLRRGAIEVDRMAEIVEHSVLLFKNVIMKIFTLPTQAILSPILSIPMLIAEAINPKGVSVIPTPFTENVVHEMQELLKYFDPNYTAKTYKAANGNGGILIDAIARVIKNKRGYCDRMGRKPQACDPTQVVVLGRPFDGPMGMSSPLVEEAPSKPPLGPFDQLLSRLRG